MTMYIKKAQSGRSMIEMLGVLAIVGILSAGGIAGYSMAMQSYKTSALTEKVNLIAQQSRVLYNGVYSDTTPNSQGTKQATADGSMGDRLLQAGMITDLNNPFGEYLAVQGGTTNFTVTTMPATKNIPSEACIKLVRTDWGNTGVFTSVTVKGTSDTTFTSVASADAAITACKGGNSQIIWTFK